MGRVAWSVVVGVVVAAGTFAIRVDAARGTATGPGQALCREVDGATVCTVAYPGQTPPTPAAWGKEQGIAVITAMPLEVRGEGSTGVPAPVRAVDYAMAARTAGRGAATGAGAPFDYDAPRWMPATCRAHWALFRRAGADHGIAPTLLAIVSLIESGCGGAASTSAGADGVIRSGAGASGVMQIMPATAQGIAANRGLELPADWRTNAAVQVDYGAWLMASEMRAYGQDAAADPDYVETIRLACIAYNGGPGAVLAYRRGAPYAESLSHSGLVVGMWRERALQASATFDRWYGAGGSAWVDRWP